MEVSIDVAACYGEVVFWNQKESCNKMWMGVTDCMQRQWAEVFLFEVC